MEAEYSKELVQNLPDAYKKTTDSNNFKILEIERIACQTLRDGLQAISDILDINNATGKTLDLYGERVGQARGIADDEKYLFLIKSKIMRNLSNGSYPSVISALCATFDCEPSQVFIADGEEPCTVKVITLPLPIINEAGFTTEQTLEIIKSMLPIGVSVDSFLFEGTFEFGSIDIEYDESKGFGNIEQTVGGYLSYIGSDNNSPVLPI